MTTLDEPVTEALLRFFRRSSWRLPESSDPLLGPSLRELKNVNVEIRDELRAGSRQGRRAHSITTVIGILTLVTAVVGVIVTTQVREGVENLTLSPQQIVDQLRIGMDQDELAKLAGVPPVVDSVVRTQSEIAGGTVRRVLFTLPEKDIAIMALVDAFNDVRLLTVTALKADIQLTYPPDNSGTYALVDFHGDGSGRFTTGKTTLGELVDVCLDGYSGFGSGASWGYLAVGCDAYGYNNFDVNIVAINFHGPGISQRGLSRFDIAAQLEQRKLDSDVAALTFNTLAWSEGYFISGDDSSAHHLFQQFVRDFELGPWRGEPA